MAKELIRLQNVSMSFDGETVLDSIDLTINDHEFLTLLGPSGCGKTTTLRIIGGFQKPTSGDVFFDGERSRMRRPSCSARSCDSMLVKLIRRPAPHGAAVVQRDRACA